MMVFQKIMFIETNLAARNKQQIAFVQLLGGMPDAHTIIFTI